MQEKRLIYGRQYGRMETIRDTANRKKERKIKMKIFNEKTVTMKLKRSAVCDLLLAITAVSQASDAKKWKELHDKVKTILQDFDNKNA